MSVIMKDVKNYIDYLRESGINVSLALCGNDEMYGDDLPDLYNYSVHTNRVCSYLKSHAKTQGRCIAEKEKLRKNPPLGPCAAVCYVGVCDYIFPAKSGGKTVALCFVTGHRINNAISQRRFEKTAAIYGDEYISCYNELDNDMPDFKQISAAVTPLCYMLARLYEQAAVNRQGSANEPWYRQALSFIYDNYMNDIDAAAVAEKVSYSESYLRRLFRDKCGQSIGAFIADVRLSKAAELLKTTNYSVSYIASLCGYSDANYFSSAFKKKYSLSPKNYRKKHFRSHVS